MTLFASEFRVSNSPFQRQLVTMDIAIMVDSLYKK